jgi:hypothetical protein
MLESAHRISEGSFGELAPFVGKKTAIEITDHFAKQRALAEGARNPQEIETAFVQ